MMGLIDRRPRGRARQRERRRDEGQERERDIFEASCRGGPGRLAKLVSCTSKPRAFEEGMSPKAELLVGALSWLLAVGLIAAIIGEAIR